VERSGFSLELMLDLSKEFAGYKDAKDKLAEGLKKHATLTGYVMAMEKQAEEQKSALNSELAGLKAQVDRERTYAKKLEEDRYSLVSSITQLQADAAHEEELRRFYEVYYNVSRFLDRLANWDQVAFFRCNSAATAIANMVSPTPWSHFCTDQAPLVCPHCKSGWIFDTEAYEALHMPLGSWVKFKKGGQS